VARVVCGSLRLLFRCLACQQSKSGGNPFFFDIARSLQRIDIPRDGDGKVCTRDDALCVFEYYSE
jgi:hypothetical protein